MNVFAVQDEIAGKVAAELKVKLLTNTATLKSTNPEAYTAYLKGWDLLKHRSRSNLAKAVIVFKRAIKLDPSYAPAWVGLGESLLNQSNSAYIPSETGYQEAQEAIEQALIRDPELAEAHAEMAEIKAYRNWIGMAPMRPTKRR